MVAVDTSVWVEYFRGAPAVVAELNSLLDDDDVLLPAPVWIELLSGASAKELPVLRNVLSAIPKVFPSKSVWKTIEVWIGLSTKRGRRFGFGDLLIAAICSEAEAAIWSLDKDFSEMSKLKFVKLH